MNSRNDASNLFAAVSKAADHALSIDEFDDRLLLQKGCYILNCKGYGPRFDFSLYIHGPYSPRLADEYYAHFDSDGPTDVPDEVIAELREIFSQGIGYTEAYATLMLVINHNPGVSKEAIIERTEGIKPHLKSEIEKAAKCLI